MRTQAARIHALQNRAARRLIALLLLCCFVLGSLAGCSGKQAEPRPNITYAQLVSAMNRQLDTPLSDELGEGRWWGTVNGHLMAYGLAPQNPDDPTAPRSHLLLSVEMDGSSYASVRLTLPQPGDGTPRLQAAVAAREAGRAVDYESADGFDLADRSITGVLADAEGRLYLVLDDILYHGGKDTGMQMAERAVTLCGLREDGTLQPIAPLVLPEDDAPLEMLAPCLLDEDGGLWLAAGSYTENVAFLLRYAVADGSLQATLPLPDGAGLSLNDPVLPLSDGRLAVIGRTTDTTPEGHFTSTYGLYILQGLNTGAPAWADPQPLPGELQNTVLYGFAPGIKGGGDTAALRAGESICQWDPVTNEVLELLSWGDYSVDSSQVNAVFTLADGRYLAVCRELVEDAPYRLRILTPLDPAVIAGRTVLTFGMRDTDLTAADIKAVINAFNAGSAEYYVKIVEYNSQSMLYDAIISGNVPDIFMVQNMWAGLAGKGFWLDLYPYIDADPDLAREDLVPGILAACEYEGTLPSIVPAYRLYTVVADPAFVGEGTGWTLEDFFALCDAYPDATPFFRQTNFHFLRDLMAFSGSTILDWNTRQAHFDSPEFVRMLELSARQPAELDYSDNNCKEALQRHDLLLLPEGTYFGDAWIAHNFNYVFENSYVYKGYPTADGGSGNGAYETLRLGISSFCEHPDAAWQLLRCFLLPAYQNTLGNGNADGLPSFPLRLDSLQKCIQRAADGPRWEENATRRVFFAPFYIPTELLTDEINLAYQQAIPQKDADALLEAICGVRQLFLFDPTVFEIVTEEAEYYYNGVRSAAEAAAIIQDRVQKYLDEQA